MSKMPYSQTTVDSDKSMAQISKLLREYGASAVQWSSAFDKGLVELKFAMPAKGKPRENIVIRVRPPSMAAKHKTFNQKTGHSEIIELPNWAQSLRLTFYWLKSKLEAVKFGLVEFEPEFLANVVVELPSGQQSTVYEALQPFMHDQRLDVPALPEPEVKKDAF